MSLRVVQRVSLRTSAPTVHAGWRSRRLGPAALGGVAPGFSVVVAEGRDGVPVIDGTMPLTESRRSLDRGHNIGLRAADRVRQCHSLGDPRRDGRRQGATGAVRVRRLDPLCLEQVKPVIVEQHVGQIVAFHMPALEDDRRGAHGFDFRRRRLHVIQRSDRPAQKRFGFGDVGRDHVRQR